MDLSALHGKRLAAAVVFVAATVVLAVQLITPSPVVVSIGQDGAQTTRVGQYFTVTDVGTIAIAASLLGASGTFLLVHDPVARSAPSQAGSARGTEPASASGGQPPAALDGGDAAGNPDRHEEWEATLDRLRNNEETVYSLVLDADGRLPQREIVEGTELSKATVSRTLDTLESKDLVERKRRGMGNVVVLT